MEICLLFLDVDGVLNNSNKSKEFDEQCIKNLKNIVNHTNCKIIISSTYRLENSSFNRLWNTLSSFGIDFKDDSFKYKVGLLLSASCQFFKVTTNMPSDVRIC